MLMWTMQVVIANQIIRYRLFFCYHTTLKLCYVIQFRDSVAPFHVFLSQLDKFDILNPVSLLKASIIA